MDFFLKVIVPTIVFGGIFIYLYVALLRHSWPFKGNNEKTKNKQS